ncbi:hypothetical protein DD876_13300, partial [Staphylococcus pseudintermedius]
GGVEVELLANGAEVIADLRLVHGAASLETPDGASTSQLLGDDGGQGDAERPDLADLPVPDDAELLRPR